MEEMEKYLDKYGDNDLKEDSFNHIHRCELELLHYNDCPFHYDEKELGNHEKCEYCNHLRIFSLNKNGTHITSISKLNKKEGE